MNVEVLLDHDWSLNVHIFNQNFYVSAVSLLMLIYIGKDIPNVLSSHSTQL